MGLDRRFAGLHHPHPGDPHHLGDDLAQAEGRDQEVHHGGQARAEEEREAEADNSDHGYTHIRWERRDKLALELTEDISAFLLCWWPYAIYFMSGLEEPNVLGKLVILAYLNSLINPCLYIFINREVRNRIKNILSFNFARQEEFQELSSV